jgi:DNA-binding IclR family transcriptional regulator
VKANKLAVLADLAEHGPSAIGQVVARTGIHKATVRNNLWGMSRPTIGWIDRRPLGDDRYEWTITPAGRGQLTEKETT